MLPLEINKASSSSYSNDEEIPRTPILEKTPIFPREGLTPDVWIGVSDSIFQENLVPDAHHLIRTICQLGAKVVILSKYYHPNQRIYPSEYTIATEERMVKNCQELSEQTLNQVTRLRALPEIEFGDLWVRDYIGHFGFTSKYIVGDLDSTKEIIHLECGALPIKTYPPDLRGSFDSILGSYCDIGYQRLNLRLVGGATVFLGDDSVLVTEEYLKRWAPNTDLIQLQNDFAKIGRDKVIIVPAIDNNSSHADTIACQIGNVVYIPELDLQTIDDNSDLLRMKIALDSAATIIESHEFQVERLIMPLPLIPFSSKWMSSPANLLQVKNQSGKQHVILPWPLAIGEGNSIDKPFGLCIPTIPWRDQDRHLEYQEINKSRLLSNGIESVTYISVNTSCSGSLHCATCEIPDSVYQVLKDKLHLEKLNYITF